MGSTPQRETSQTAVFFAVVGACLSRIEAAATDDGAGDILAGTVVEDILAMIGPTTESRLEFADLLTDFQTSDAIGNLARIVRRAALANATPPVVRPHSHEPPTASPATPST